MVTSLIADFEHFISKVSSLLNINGRVYIDILTCSGMDGERKLDEHIFRTKDYFTTIINKNHLTIRKERIGPSQFAIAYYLELEKNLYG